MRHQRRHAPEVPPLSAPRARGPEAVWAALFQAIDDALCVLEPIDPRPRSGRAYRFVAANQPFAAYAGTAEVVGRTVQQVMPEHSEAWMRLCDDVATRRMPGRAEWAQSGRMRVFDAHAFPMGDASEGRVAVRLRDVTDLVRAREHDRMTLADSSTMARALAVARDAAAADTARLNLALDAAGLGDWSYDVHSDLVTLSERAAAIFRVPSGTPMTWTAMRQLLHADDRERARVAVETAVATRTDYCLDYRIVNDDRERWVTASGRALYDETGRVLGMFGVLQEITPDRLLVQLDDAVRVLTDPEEIIETAARMLGTHLDATRCAYATAERHADTFRSCLEDMAGGTPFVVMDSERDVRLDEARRTTFSRDGVRAMICAPILKASRVVAAMTVHAAEPRRWTEGEVQLVERVASRLWESIERARIEREQARLLESAEAANRAKDEFLAMLGHELRNPLSPILTALQLMELRGDTSSARERTVIERQVRHLTRLVDDLLDVSRITRGKVALKMELVDVRDVVTRAVEMSSPLFEMGTQTLNVDVPPGLVVFGDPGRLAQVVSNLLSNASKYTPADGHIDVSAAVDGDDVVLRVRDTGMGIAADMLPVVFDLFAQGRQAIDRSKGGLGLGLAIVRSLVRRHGGRVTAHSAGPGMGSEFVVRLPGAPLPQASGDADDGQAAHLGATPRARILVVDDNEDAATLLADALRLMGHDVEVAHDGLAAMRLAATRPFHAAFLDIGLPVMDGFELAAQLRRLPTLREARLVAVTGYGQASDRSRTRAAGFDDHLVKPVDLDAVEQVVRDLRPDAAPPPAP